ncbi:MAG TPA: multicopper oxidase family protein [Alloacidobacterium sp.]|nr:multicopper oxidase family protein [Alloacidobacterium sp.]
MNRREFLFGAMAASASAMQRSRPPDLRLEISSIRHEVAPGFVYSTTAYNGQAPAPILRLRQGVPVTVEIANNTAFEEYAHWHGFEIPSLLDGTMEEASLAVPAYGNIHYTLTPHLEGLRWVHSHAMSHGRLDRGVYSGQYGIVYIEPRNHPGAYDREFFLATHEWGAEMRQIPDSEEDTEEAEDLGPMGLPSGGSWEVQYDIGSINGKALGTGEPLRVREREHVLFHILNASATVTQSFALPGHRFEVVALDGNVVPHPREVEVLELGPGERISTLVRMTNPGVWIFGATRGSDRENGRMGIVVEYAGRSGTPQWKDPSLQPWDYAIFSKMCAQPKLASEQLIPMVIDREEAEDGMDMWTINGKHYDGVPVRLHAGLRYRLLFENRSDEDHPVHLHRHSFELTRLHGRALGGIWKDVVLLKRYASMEVDFTPVDKGLSLFHCHQQMHMDRGFKKLFEVV